MQDLIEITDKNNEKRMVEVVDKSHNYLARYKGDNIVNLDTNLSPLELELAEIIFKGVKE